MNTLNVNNGKIIAQYYIKQETDDEYIFFTVGFKIHIPKNSIEDFMINQIDENENIEVKVNDLNKVVIE